MWVTPCGRRRRPEPAGRPLGHEHHGGADAEHREERPALGVDVEERQVDQVAVVGAQVDVAGPGAAGPHRVGVGVHDGLRAARGARGEHDPERAASARSVGRPRPQRRRRRRASSNRPKPSTVRRCAASPLLSAVTAIHFSDGAASATIAAYCGWVMAATRRCARRSTSISAPTELGVGGDRRPRRGWRRPARPGPSRGSSRRGSGPCRPWRCPGSRRPAARPRSALAAARRRSSVRPSPSGGSHTSAGWSGLCSAQWASSQGMSWPCIWSCSIASRSMSVPLGCAAGVGGGSARSCVDGAGSSRAAEPTGVGSAAGISSRTGRGCWPRPTWRSTARRRRRPAPRATLAPSTWCSPAVPRTWIAASAKRSRPEAPMGLDDSTPPDMLTGNDAVERGLAALDHLPALALGRRCGGPRATWARTS